LRIDLYTLAKTLVAAVSFYAVKQIGCAILIVASSRVALSSEEIAPNSSLVTRYHPTAEENLRGSASMARYWF
jgi:hypothetical protein